MAAKNLFTNKYKINKARYTMLYSFDNVYSIFSPRGTENTIVSMNYDCDRVYHHSCFSVEDVLKDIFFLSRARAFEVSVNDVIVVKINGATFCFQMLNKVPNFNIRNYMALPNFLHEEYNFYKKQFHSDGYVLNVIDGLLLDIKKSCRRGNKYYCIEEETFNRKDSNRSTISSVYSFYMLNFDIPVNKVYKKNEFVSIGNALYQFDSCRRNDSSSVLLLDRSELDMIADNRFVVDNTFSFDAYD